MPEGSHQISDAAQSLLSYVMSLKLTASADDVAAESLVSPEFIAPFSRSHWYRTTKIKGQRHEKTVLENSNVINTRVTSSLTVPTADITKLHSSRRTFDTPRALSSQRLRLGDSCRSRSSDGMNSTPRVRSKSVDSRFARLRQSKSQIEMDARILQALDRTQKETAHLVLVPSPWLPATPSSKYRYNKADVFVHSSYPSDRTEDRISPQKNTGVSSEASSSVRIFPTPPPLRNDKQSLEERAELVARLTLYRAIRRAPWSPSRRKRIDSDFEFAEDHPETLGNGPEGKGVENVSMTGSGRNHLTGEYRNEEDMKAFRRINTSIDDTYCETPVAGKNRHSYDSFNTLYEEGLPQDLYRRERSNLSKEKEREKEKTNDGFDRRQNKVENTVEALRIEVPDSWDPLKFYTDRSEESAQRPSDFNSTQQLSGFKSDVQHWDNTKTVAFDFGYGNSDSNTNSNSNSNSNGNIPSEKSTAESARSCQMSSPRSAVLSGQQAYYVLKVRVVRTAYGHWNEHRDGNGDRDVYGDGGMSHSRGMQVKGTGTAAAAVVTEQKGLLLVKRGVTKGSLLYSLSAQFPSALSVSDGESMLSITVSYTPIRSRIRVSDAFDDIRGMNSATENSGNSVHSPDIGSLYGRGVSTCDSPVHHLENESRSTLHSNKKNKSNTNSSGSGSGSSSLLPCPFTAQPEVISLAEETLDFSPVLDDTSELVISYCSGHN